MTGKLNTSARVVWWKAPVKGGEHELEGTCNLVLEAVSADVYLVADSGHDYYQPPI